MDPTRVGLLVLGAVAITSTTMLIATRRDGPTPDRASPLAASGEHAGTDPAHLALLVASIERLVQALERGSPSQLEGANLGSQRQPATPTGGESQVELLHKLDERLGEIHAALLAGGRAQAEPNRRTLELRATVESGPRPAKVNAWADYLARYPPMSTDDLPVEIAVLGVADVLEKFGWPTRATPPGSPAGLWNLDYDNIEVPTVDGLVNRIEVTCSRDATYGVDPKLPR